MTEVNVRGIDPGQVGQGKDHMNVPFVDLYAQYNEIKADIDRAIQGVISEAAFIGGTYLNSFEKNFAAYIGARHCIGVGNGTDALFIALKSLGIGAGDTVITAANSFIATSEAITMAGARVVFVDCEEKSYGMNIHEIEKAITGRTKAIIPVHLYGQPADMDRLAALAKKHGLFIVEDAAQAHGALYRGRKAGALGNCACFSFFPGKNLGAYGDAGAVVTDDDHLAERIRMFANHGRLDKYHHEFEGVNSRLDGLQAAVLDVKLRYLERWTERRREVAKMYDEGLQGIVMTPEVTPGVRHVYHLYVVRVRHREKVRQYLSKKGIATGIHYPVPLPFLKAYGYLGHKPGDFPVASTLKDEILSLPIHGSMTHEQVVYVIEQMKIAANL
jgi:dTDP-4-amino-4,6-dideoxygalactose transaminase